MGHICWFQIMIEVVPLILLILKCFYESHSVFLSLLLLENKIILLQRMFIDIKKGCIHVYWVNTN